VVIALAITHTPPRDRSDAVEIPMPVKRMLRLDDERSWVVLTEANRFVWPGPDIRPFENDGKRTISYGFLPPGFFRVVRDRFLVLDEAGRMRQIGRTE
jgi:hypothetical protein